jgi:hypothetical protein
MPELIRRLRSSVKKRDGLLVVFSVLSANSAWMITCGSGITVAFGNSTSGESGDDAKVLIAYAFDARIWPLQSARKFRPSSTGNNAGSRRLAGQSQWTPCAVTCATRTRSEIRQGGCSWHPTAIR